MSEENVELVQGFLEAFWDRRDFEAAKRLADPALELDWSESRAPYAGVVRGFERVRQRFEQVSDASIGYGVERRDLTDCGQNLVVVVQSISGRGRDSGIEVRATGATVWKVRGGKVVSGKLFQSRAEALEAAGRSE